LLLNVHELNESRMNESVSEKQRFS